MALSSLGLCPFPPAYRESVALTHFTLCRRFSAAEINLLDIGFSVQSFQVFHWISSCVLTRCLVPAHPPPSCLSPVAVLGLFGHACQRWLQAAQVVVQLAGVTQHQQMLVLVLLTDATAVRKCERKSW